MKARDLGQEFVAAVPDLLRFESREPPALLFVEATEEKVDGVVQVPVGMFLTTDARRTLALVDRDVRHNRHSLGSTPPTKGSLRKTGSCSFLPPQPELALAMVADAVAGGLPFRWVTGDSVYGDSPSFCQGVRALEKWYVLDSSSDARVWTSQPEVLAPGRKPARGRATSKPKVTTKPLRVDEVVAGLPPAAWRRVTVAEGSQGPLVYEYAEVRVWFSEHGLPSGPERLLVRRSLGQEPELKYHRTNASVEVTLATLASIRSKRWSIEQDFQNGKGECGLDEYETRGWRGWHHHTALSVLALWFLARQRDRSGGKKSGPERARGAGVVAAPARRAVVG